MKKISLLLIIFLVSIFIVDCTTEPNSGGKTIDITSKILVELKENLSESNRTVNLFAETDSIYPCINYSIYAQKEQTGNTISINFVHIIVPEVCADALGPAKSNINLGTLQNGNYEANFLVNTDIFTTTLKVDDEKYLFIDAEDDWIRITKPELRKVPQNTIWGWIGYSSDSTYYLEQVNAVKDSLLSKGAVTNNFAAGYYGYFTIDDEGNVDPPENPGTNLTETFIYNFNGTEEDLINLLTYFANNSPLSISIFTSEGKKYYQWEYAGN